MRRHRWICVPTTFLLLSACGGNQATIAPTTAAVATSAPLPTDDPSLFRAEPTAAPSPTAAPAPTASPTAQPEPTAEPLPPTTAPQPRATAAPRAAQRVPAAAPATSSAPTRLVIADIKLDYRPVSVGLDRDNVPIVPNHDVGWYNLSAAPGQGDNIVFWGHVLRFRSAPKLAAPFARLKELKPGASVVLYDASGAAHNYAITRQVWVTPDQVEYILPQGKEMVTLVSCIGDKVIQDGEVIDESHRLITIAEPA